MIGPNKTSLLHKLGQKLAWEMTEAELHELVAKEQQRRTIQRALGRAQRVIESDEDGTYTLKQKGPGRPRTKSRVKATKKKDEPAKLEDFGLKGDLVVRLRATGKPDFQLILELQMAGII